MNNKFGLLQQSELLKKESEIFASNIKGVLSSFFEDVIQIGKVPFSSVEIWLNIEAVLMSIGKDVEDFVSPEEVKSFLENALDMFELETFYTVANSLCITTMPKELWQRFDETTAKLLAAIELAKRNILGMTEEDFEEANFAEGKGLLGELWFDGAIGKIHIVVFDYQGKADPKITMTVIQGDKCSTVIDITNHVKGCLKKIGK